MTFLSPSDSIDLSNCEREPIHIPGFIQPYGHLILINEDQTITACNQGLLTLSQKVFNEIIGHNLISVFPGFKEFNFFSNESSIQMMELLGDKFYVRKFEVAGSLCGLELLSSTESSSASLQDFIFLSGKLEEITSVQSLLGWGQLVTQTIQKLLGYNRVMLYRFDEDFNGEILEEIIDEKSASFLEPYKGLHYPASDIPPQARHLYTKKLSRLIVDIGYRPDALVPESLTIDLTNSYLRSVSPIHLEYLSNMGVKGTFVLSIMIQDKLWGLISCHHMSEKNLSYSQQRKAETFVILAGHVLQSLMDKDKSHQEKEALTIIKNIFNCPADTPLSGLLNDSAELFLKLVHTDSGLVKIMNKSYIEVGRVPSRDKVSKLVNWLEEKHFENGIFISKKLGIEFPEFWSEKAYASGLLAMQLHDSSQVKPQDQSYLLWFKPEVHQTINWGGNPNEKLNLNEKTGRLSPRGSFSLWSEVTKGQSLPWSDHDVLSAKIFKAVLLDFLAAKNAIKRRQAEDLYMQSQRVVDLGRMAATAAHDFNNILQGMVSAIDLNDDILPAEFSKRIETFAERGKVIVKSLLSYARTKREDYEAINVDTFCDEVLILGKVLLPKSINFQKEYLASPNDSIMGSKQELFQSLINMIVNAKDAIGVQAGEITFKCTKNLDKIIFTIEDDGPGIPPENLQRIFDPFFSTKTADKGTGLGLSYIKQIVEAHWGTISLESQLGTGSKFILSFPLIIPKDFQVNQVNQIVQIDSSVIDLSGLRILYVEDDPDLLETNKFLFERTFKSVEAFLDARKALESYVGQESNIDLIISDLRMAGMDGIEFYRRVRALNQNVSFALMSGELELGNLIGDLPERDSIILLPKPCRKSELIQKLSQGIKKY